MANRVLCVRGGVLVASIVLGAVAASACPAHRATRAAHCHDLAVAAHRHHHSRTGWAPVIPPFDQDEAEAEVHEIAPYRTYPYYPLYPDFAPYPYAW